MHKASKTFEKGYKYTRPTFHYTHPFRLLLNKVRKINKPFWTFIIGFEEAKAYHWRNYGVHTHKSKWEDIVVNVYI